MEERLHVRVKTGDEGKLKATSSFNTPVATYSFKRTSSNSLTARTFHSRNSFNVSDISTNSGSSFITNN